MATNKSYKPFARVSTDGRTVDARIVSGDYRVWGPRILERYLREVERGGDTGKWARRCARYATGELKVRTK